uniref:Uncharacterized protein n=1 Tax=Arundo donax TaxID=35708 RepID=A0A0A8Z5W4_ARUDO
MCAHHKCDKLFCILGKHWSLKNSCGEDILQ